MDMDMKHQILFMEDSSMEKKTIIKRIIGLSSFFITLMVIYMLSTKVFLPNRVDEAYFWKYNETFGFEYEEEDSLDILFTGNSNCYSSFIPTMLYNNYGYTSYNVGFPYGDPGDAYNYIKYVYSTQKNLKCVVLEADSIYLPFESNKLEASLQKNRKYSAPYTCHARWKELTKSDFTDFGEDARHDINKGYAYFEKTYKCKYKNYMTKSNSSILYPETIVNMLKIKKFCDKHNMDFLVVASPCQASWNATKSSRLASFLKGRHIDFIDFNLLLDEIDFRTSTDYYDNGLHTNYYGATKVTTYLGNFINENYKYTDHRGDEKYSQWNTDAKAFLNKYNLKSY